MKSLSCVRLFATPWTVAYQAPLSMGFSRQEYWSGLPFPSPGDLPDPGIEPRSPELRADTSHPSHQGRENSCQTFVISPFLLPLFPFLFFCCSVVKSCLTGCGPMDPRTSGYPVLFLFLNLDIYCFISD